MIVQRVEKQIIKPTNEYYSMLDEFCYLSKNLYNHANYLVRQEFTQNDKWLCYGEMDKFLKTDVDFPDYKAMPTAQSAQQVLRLLEKDWKSFFATIKDWSKNKDKYLGRPKIPKYVNKNGRKILIMTAQNCNSRFSVSCVIFWPTSDDLYSFRPYQQFLLYRKTGL
jgi:putative transposase